MHWKEIEVPDALANRFGSVRPRWSDSRAPTVFWTMWLPKREIEPKMQFHSVASRWFHFYWQTNGNEIWEKAPKQLYVRAIQRLHNEDANKYDETHQDTVFEHEIRFLHEWEFPFSIAKMQQHTRHVATKIRSFIIFGIVTVVFAMTRK